MLSQLIQDFVEKKAKDTISDAIGISPDLLKKVDTDMIGSLIGGLTSNAKKGDAPNIVRALKDDHEGIGLDELPTLLKDGEVNGKGILEHVLGSQQKNIEAYIAKKYDLDPKMVASVMSMIAPVVMNYLAKERKDRDMDDAQLTQYLQEEEKAILDDPANNTNPLINFLDKDGDGDVDLMDFV